MGILMQHILEKMADWKIQAGTGITSFSVAGVSANDAIEHGVEVYHWLALGVSGFAALVTALSLAWKIYTYFDQKKNRK